MDGKPDGMGAYLKKERKTIFNISVDGVDVEMEKE